MGQRLGKGPEVWKLILLQSQYCLIIISIITKHIYRRKYVWYHLEKSIKSSVVELWCHCTSGKTFWKELGLPMWNIIITPLCKPNVPYLSNFPVSLTFCGFRKLTKVLEENARIFTEFTKGKRRESGTRREGDLYSSFIYPLKLLLHIFTIYNYYSSNKISGRNLLHCWIVSTRINRSKGQPL